jgi:hypothetical protein
VKLWIFETPNRDCDYDQWDAFVIAAKDQARAVELATEFLDNGLHQKVRDFDVREVVPALEMEGVLIDSFHAG